MSWMNGEWQDNTYTPEPYRWCPACPDPENLPDLWTMRYCAPHEPTIEGASDRLVGEPTYVGHSEAGGEPNRIWNDLIYGRLPQ